VSCSGGPPDSAASTNVAADGEIAVAGGRGREKNDEEIHLGVVVTPALDAEDVEKLLRDLELQKSPQQGAATSVLLAASPQLDGIGGRYFADCNEATLVDHRPEGFTEPAIAVAPYALDPDNARRLWKLSVAAVS
jgi:hypothetical protein